MKKFWAILIIAIIIVLQTLPQFKVFGFFPNLIVIFIVYYSFKVGVSQGIVLGAILGLCVDILSGSYIGTHSLSFSTVALSVEFFKIVFIFEMPFTVPIVSFFATIVNYFVMFVLSLVFRSISLGEWYISMFVEGALNFVLAFPMSWVSNKIVSLLHKEYYMEI